jgi:hypothetical protein
VNASERSRLVVNETQTEPLGLLSAAALTDCLQDRGTVHLVARWLVKCRSSRRQRADSGG